MHCFPNMGGFWMWWLSKQPNSEDKRRLYLVKLQLLALQFGKCKAFHSLTNQWWVFEP